MDCRVVSCSIINMVRGPQSFLIRRTWPRYSDCRESWFGVGGALSCGGRGCGWGRGLTGCFARPKAFGDRKCLKALVMCLLTGDAGK